MTATTHTHIYEIDNETGLGTCLCGTSKQHQHRWQEPHDALARFGAIPSHIHRPRRADWGAEDRDE